MKREHILAAVLSFCTTLRLSQSKALSELVCAATKLSQAGRSGNTWRLSGRGVRRSRGIS
jgi:hypothetical protein